MTELTRSPSQGPPPPVDRISGGPPSGRFSFPPGVVPPKVPTGLEVIGQNFVALLAHLGRISTIFTQAVGALLRRPLELRAIIYQMESLGVRSVGIASVTAVFIGMVMAVQFAFGLQKFGGMEYTGRVVGLSFARELAPTLTAVIVGGRIGSGMTAEVGSMAVTEQIDAIYALGADPIKKLVVPRLVASILVMPILATFSLVLGFSGAMIVTASQFNVSAGFFLKSALDTLQMTDFLSGVLKCPVFGAIIALIGCYFGLITTGGTEGVGRSTTRSVVAISISILIADFFLTKFYMFIWSQ
ncbi:MAG TPA: ABC transporter permease [Polyangiaceae bacterium]|nr:ABC transporter permease [Polyangiaceae bacterium]